MVKFQVPNPITFRDMNYYPVTDGRTDRQTESDAYEPTVQYAQVGSIIRQNVKGGSDFQWLLHYNYQVAAGVLLKSKECF